MARPSFYDHNEGISFPFRDGSVGRPAGEVGATSVRRLPVETIVDLGVLVGLDISFDPATDWFYLGEVRRVDDQFFFRLQGSSGQSVNFALEFCRDVDEEEFAVEYGGEAIELTTLPQFILPLVTPDFTLSGYLVTGDLAPLAALMSNGDTWTGGSTDVIVENALVRPLHQSYTRTINIYNTPRTRSQAPDGCPPIVFGAAVPDEGIFVVREGITGNVRLQEGYNADLIVNPADNSITIGAARGGGEGEPCEEVEEYPGETPPPGSSLLSGGPSCNELLRSVNGVGGPVLRIESGRGVRLEPDPDANTLKVIVDLSDLVTCEESS